MYRSSFRTFPSYLNSRANSTHNTWTTVWSFRRFSSKTQSSFILSTTNWTIEVFIPYFYINPKRNVLFECIPINSLTVQKSVSQKSQNRLFFIKKIYHKKSTQGNTVPAGWKWDLNRCTRNDKTLSANWQFGQSSYIALSCKISLLSRQRTTKALIRLRGFAGWSASLLFTYDKNRVSHDSAHFHINRSYLCRIRRKRVYCIQFYGEKKKT